MSPVLDAKKPKKALTNSQKDVFRNLEINNNYVEGKLFCFPELYVTLVDAWELPPNTVTTSTINTLHMAIETLDKFEGPLMPPKRKFRVRLNIREIKRGKPSICDDIEV
jgi:hypothetical protein